MSLKHYIAYSEMPWVYYVHKVDNHLISKELNTGETFDIRYNTVENEVLVDILQGFNILLNEDEIQKKLTMFELIA